MCKIISLITDKQVLKVMMREYLKMDKKYNSIIDEFRIPQRIIAVILLQYNDCKVQDFSVENLSLSEA
jgi:hypothetical protein